MFHIPVNSKHVKLFIGTFSLCEKGKCIMLIMIVTNLIYIAQFHTSGIFTAYIVMCAVPREVLHMQARCDVSGFLSHPCSCPGSKI